MQNRTNILIKKFQSVKSKQRTTMLQKLSMTTSNYWRRSTVIKNDNSNQRKNLYLIHAKVVWKDRWTVKSVSDVIKELNGTNQPFLNMHSCVYFSVPEKGLSLHPPLHNGHCLGLAEVCNLSSAFNTTLPRVHKLQALEPIINVWDSSQFSLLLEQPQSSMPSHRL